MTRCMVIALSAGLLIAGNAAAAPAQDGAIDMAALTRRVAPGAGQARLRPLLGRWRVAKTNYLLGPPGRPAVSRDMTTVRAMVGDGRFVADTTIGLLGGRRYYRTGLLGYNSVARRYEFVTADNVTPILMAYHSQDGTMPAAQFSMTGTFADPGITGEANVGKAIPMRTEVRIVSDDRHQIDLYFTPPGRPEQLVDRMIYTRLKAARRR